MKNKLLNYLKSSIALNWLHYYRYDSASETKHNYSSLLYQLTKEKLARIQSTSTQNPQNLTVFVVEKNPIEFISAFLAGVIAEVQVFLCNPAWQQREWQQVFNLVKPDLVLGDAAGSNAIQIDPKAIATMDTDSGLIMIPTGGTSGKIKFAIHDWSTLTASVDGFQQFFECQAINSWCTLPLYHVSGLMQLMRSLVTQGDLVLCPYQLTAPDIVRDPSDYFISLVPTQLQFLLDSRPNWLKQFKTVLVGGAPARRSLLDCAREAKIAIALIYGSTETASGVVALKPEEFWAGNTSNGKALPHARIWLDSCLYPIKFIESKGDRRTGTIMIKSTSNFKGYYPRLTSAESLRADDSGYIDSLGYVYLVGRDSHKIITGGENVFPQEVEAAIYDTNLVDAVCVLGIPDPYWGQAVTAVYVPSIFASDSSSIEQQIQSQLAKYKQPKNWIEVDYLPRHDNGKIDYQQLKAIAIKQVSNNNNI